VLSLLEANVFIFSIAAFCEFEKVAKFAGEVAEKVMVRFKIITFLVVVIHY
jgi:hypothetical protein